MSTPTESQPPHRQDSRTTPRPMDTIRIRRRRHLRLSPPILYPYSTPCPPLRLLPRLHITFPPIITATDMDTDRVPTEITVLSRHHQRQPLTTTSHHRRPQHPHLRLHIRPSTLQN